MNRYAICGASGAVGQEVLQLLIDRKRVTDSAQLSLFSSARSAGQTVTTSVGDIVMQEFSPEIVRDFTAVFLCVSGDFSKEHAPTLTEQNQLVIDNSSAFRYDDAVPLVVPEINAEAIGEHTLIANPNCTTAILVMALWPLYTAFGLKRVIVSTYQAASGAGHAGMDELKAATKASLAAESYEPTIFQHSLAFNIIPHIDAFQENGYTKEEMKVTWETRKIFNNPDLSLSCTAVRIPALRAHSESVTIETEKPVDLKVVRDVLTNAEGVELVDDPVSNQYPMPVTATGKAAVEVGRVRENPVFGDRGLDFFVSGDQLLRGAALNAVLIAEAVETV